MTPESLLAEAAVADADADAIFAKMADARAAQGPDVLGFHAHIPAGFQDEAQTASDLRRRARALRTEAAERDEPAGPQCTGTLPPQASTASESACSLSHPASGAVDPVEAIAARILASDTLPGDEDVERAPKRIKKGDGPADVEDVVRRILKA